jgi:hypothetical protein
MQKSCRNGAAFDPEDLPVIPSAIMIEPLFGQRMDLVTISILV